MSEEPDAVRFSDGAEKPIEAVAKGECRARVDIEKLNARSQNKTAKGSRENDGMVNFGGRNYGQYYEECNAVMPLDW